MKAIFSEEWSLLSGIADYIFVLDKIGEEWDIREEQPLSKGIHVVNGSTHLDFYQTLFEHVDVGCYVLVLTQMSELADCSRIRECVQKAFEFIESGYAFDILDLDGWITWTATTPTTTGVYRLIYGADSRAALYSPSGQQIIKGMRVGWIRSLLRCYVIRPSLCMSPPLGVTRHFFLLFYIASRPRHQKPILAKNNRFRWLIPMEWELIDVLVHLPSVMQYIGSFSIRNFRNLFPEASSLLWEKIFAIMSDTSQTIELVRTIMDNEPDVLYVGYNYMSCIRQKVADLVTDGRTNEWDIIQLLMTEHSHFRIHSTIIEQPFTFDIRALRHFRLGKRPQFYQSLASKLWESNKKQIFYLINGLRFR